MKNGILSNGNAKISKISFTSSFPFLAMIIALLVGGALGIFGTYALIVVLGILIMTCIITLRQDEVAIMAIIATEICVDWYLGLHIVSQLIAIVLLSIFFLTRSLRYPWIEPRALWLWILFLILPIPAVIQGNHQLYDLAFYYPNIFFGALIMFWLGMLVARNKIHLRNLFRALAILGALLAIHTIIQAKTGIVLFGSSRFDAYLTQVSNFALANSGDISRAGAFFENPDWNGTFFSIVLFLPLGLFTEASSFLQKFLYFTEMLLMLIALLFTYTAGAWIGALGGMMVFILFTGRSYYRILVPILMVIMGGLLVIFFPVEINLLFQHASNPTELSLRTGAWQTAINVIRAFPITGVGLGFTNYELRAEPFRVPTQPIPLAHPHNSYLELSAMAGLPVLIVFLALLLFALWRAWRNWLQVDTGMRCLLSGGIATIVALSVNSVSINGWTLPPLAAIGWLVLGAIVSPLLTRKESSEKMPGRSTAFGKDA
jgi:O-antigen ligase